MKFRLGLKQISFISSLIFTLLLSACGGNETTTGNNNEVKVDTTITKAVVTDNPDAEVTAADTSSTGVYQEEVDENAGNSLQDALKANNTQTKVEESGMSFCDCVKKQKELSDKMMADETTDEEFDKAMADLEALKKGDCKFMFDIKQNTIDAKQAYQRKVKKCL